MKETTESQDLPSGPPVPFDTSLAGDAMGSALDAVEAGGRRAGTDPELGRRIKELRTERSMTLETLAGGAGVTRSFLSTVERGRSNPSIAVLRAIAAALGVPVFMLFTDPHENVTIVRPQDRGRISPGGSPVTYELLSPDLQRKIEMILMRLEPGAQSALGMHEGEESAFLLHGNVVVTVGDVDYPMQAGDAIYFNAGLPHFVTSAGSDEAVLVSAVTPPSF